MSQNGLSNEEAWAAKHQEILDCLAGKRSDGSVEDTIDLWKLRELSLSPGGLLSPDLRKRAWPLLTGCHVDVLEVAKGSPVAPRIGPCPSDLAALRHDVGKAVWNVEEHLAVSRKVRQLEDEKFRAVLEEHKRKNAKRVSFAPGIRFNTEEVVGKILSPVKEEELDTPTSVATTSTESTDEEEDELQEEKTEQEEDAASIDERSFRSSGSVASLGSWCTTGTYGTCGSTVSNRLQFRRSSPLDREILFNVVSSMLRTPYQESDLFEDDRYRYYAGLQDVTALLVINLESPSLASWILVKLAPSHLRDATRHDRTVLGTALQLAFMPLLNCVDDALYRHLTETAGLTLPQFALPWMASWFAQDMPDLRFASRLADVFLASHPLLPLYVSVALLTVNRSRVLRHGKSGPQRLSDLYQVLRSLPMTSLMDANAATSTDQVPHQEEDDDDNDFSESSSIMGGMSLLEDVISTALKYMKRIPPRALVQMAVNHADDFAAAKVKTIAVFQEPPCFSTASIAPTYQALIQQANELRQQSREMRHRATLLKGMLHSRPVIPRDYPLAMVAAGMASRTNRRPEVIAFLLFVCTCLAGVLLFVTTVSAGKQPIDAAMPFLPGRPFEASALSPEVRPIIHPVLQTAKRQPFQSKEAGSIQSRPALPPVPTPSKAVERELPKQALAPTPEARARPWRVARAAKEVSEFLPHLVDRYIHEGGIQ